MINCYGCDDDGTDDYGLAVWLYEDSAFTDWQSALSNPTDEEVILRDSMSPYTLAMECNLTAIGTNGTTGNKSGYGCCLRDLSWKKGGGFCMVVNSARNDVDTFYMIDSEFETALADPYDISSLSAPSNAYTGITVFWINDATPQSEINASRPYQKFYGYKAQPWPGQYH